MGVPFPKGVLSSTATLRLTDPEAGRLPLQTQVLSHWSDGTLQWVLFDSLVTLRALSSKTLVVEWDAGDSHSAGLSSELKVQEERESFTVDACGATFHLDRRTFRPFSRITVNGVDLLSAPGSLVLTDAAGHMSQPEIDFSALDAIGAVRATLRFEGRFRIPDRKAAPRFAAHLHFFAGTRIVRLDLTLLNPRRSHHPRGLWDLGDPNSIMFQSLELQLLLAGTTGGSGNLKIHDDDPHFATSLSPVNYDSGKHLSGRNLLIYQDSSGGENWQSSNHVDRHGQVTTSFRGYRVYVEGQIVREGKRANPIVTLEGPGVPVSAGFRHFWQEFPKSISCQERTLLLGFFPRQSRAGYELQPGEQKTYTAYLAFGTSTERPPSLAWVYRPVIPVLPAAWHCRCAFVTHLVPETEEPNHALLSILNAAVSGANTFFHRREVIDEYGWRNYGEFFADHESQGRFPERPLVSHYNNQYDCIYGCLQRFLSGGNRLWFELADALAHHAADIDIYHTDADRQPYNRGMFWHTDHYLDAATATHRCYSSANLRGRGGHDYGGGPSYHHLYTTGFLLHYFMTGDLRSRNALHDLGAFALRNISYDRSLVRRMRKLAVRCFRRLREGAPANDRPEPFELDGPGRASGNSINTCLDALLLTRDPRYLSAVDDLIRRCATPCDDLNAMRLLDVERRWMYTIYLQVLARFLDLGVEIGAPESLVFHARATLLHYSRWMSAYERPYLDHPEILDFPNETWPAQDLRKAAIFIHAARQAQDSHAQQLLQKALYFLARATRDLASFVTSSQTRPIGVINQNLASLNITGFRNARSRAPILPGGCP